MSGGASYIYRARSNQLLVSYRAPDDGTAEVHGHFSPVTSSSYQSLDENQKAEFDTTPGAKGPQAENVCLL
jgi:CspA family cold shock protein